jgi:hypothetical protein
VLARLTSLVRISDINIAPPKTTVAIGQKGALVPGVREWSAYAKTNKKAATGHSNIQKTCRSIALLKAPMRASSSCGVMKLRLTTRLSDAGLRRDRSNRLLDVGLPRRVPWCIGRDPLAYSAT